MRMALGLTLAISLLDGLWRRSRHTFASEQGAILSSAYFGEAGSSPKQQYISTFDFSVLSMLATGIITTVRWPHKLAFIRVRSDLYQVTAEKEAEHSARRAKEQHRRVQRLASQRTKFPADELNLRMRRQRQRATTRPQMGGLSGRALRDDDTRDHGDSDSADDHVEHMHARSATEHTETRSENLVFGVARV